MFRTLPRRTLVDYCHCGIPTRHTIGPASSSGPPLKNRHCDISSRGGRGCRLVNQFGEFTNEYPS